MTVAAGDSDGAVEQARTAEPLPYQGSALPTELQQHIFCRSVIIAQTHCVCKGLFHSYSAKNRITFFFIL